MTISIMKGLSNLLLLWHAYILLAPEEDSKSSLVTICGQSEIAAVVFKSLYIIVDWCSHCIFLLPFLELNRLSYLASFSVQATMLDTSPWCKIISFYKQSLCEGEVVVWGCLTNSWEKKRSKWQRRKGKIYPTKCRAPEKKSKEKQKCLKVSSYVNNAKKWRKTIKYNGKDYRPLQENWKYQRKISCKDGHNKRQKLQGPNRNRRGGKNTQKNYTEKVLMTRITTMVWSLT